MLVRVSPWLIAKFFVRIAHGDAKHRAWLLAEIEGFWGWKLDREIVGPALVDVARVEVAPLGRMV